MAKSAIIIVPPLLKYAAGPLLGPAVLKGAAEAAGHRVRVLDLNIRYLRSRDLGSWAGRQTGFLGDHAKPEAVFGEIQAKYRKELQGLLGEPPSLVIDRDPVMTLTYPFGAVERAAHCLAQGTAGDWVASLLSNETRPDVVGFSILYSGQVVWALAVAHLVRRIWPEAVLVAGGAHVSALWPEIQKDVRYRTPFDAMLPGHSEAAFVDLLEAGPSGCIVSSTCSTADEEDPPSPIFEDLDLYGVPHLALPVQTSVGCPYGRCRFCSYPAIEGRYRAARVALAAPMVELAERHGAHLSVKDSLVTPVRLIEFASLAAGRVRWSACTKLAPQLDGEFLGKLVRSGCGTLEVGVETMNPPSQALIDKPQRFETLMGLLDAAEFAGLPLVLNMITGFPGEDESQASHWLARVRAEAARRSRLKARIEHNRFELERRAALVSDPRIQVVEEWPWATVLGWRWVQP